MTYKERVARPDHSILDDTRALISRVGRGAVREQMHRVLVLWDMGYLREALSQFRLVAEEALRRLVSALEHPGQLERLLSRGQSAQVIEQLYRQQEQIPARVALHLHTLLAWGNYASHHQKLGHHAQASDLGVLVAVALDLEDWLSQEVELSASIFDAEDLAWAAHQAEERSIEGGLPPEVARAFVAAGDGNVHAESHRLHAPALALELYWRNPPGRPAGPPYRGLEAFDPEDAGRFYGRRRLAERLVHLVDTRRMTLVCGASGAGKTSLLRAALVPPLLELGCGVLYVAEYGDQTLRALERLHRRWPPAAPLVLILDQLERVLLPEVQPGLRRGLVDLILELGRHQQGRRVVVGLREDYLGPLLRETGANADGIPPWNEEDALLTVGPLDREETREAMLRPLDGTGVSFDDALVRDVLVPDLAESPTKLQIVCGRLFEEATGRGVDVVARPLFEAMGGTERILATHLDDALSRPVYDGRRDLARALLRAMAGIEARRWLDLGELWQSAAGGHGGDLDEVELRNVLARLVDDRLVVSRKPARYSLMHDQLALAVRRWTSAREMELHQAQQSLDRALELWSDPARRELLAPRALRLVEAHWPRLQRDGEAAPALLTASRRARLGRRAGAALLLALAALGLGFGVFQLHRAVRQRDRAVTVADQGVLLRAQLALDRDPTLAVAWLRNLTSERSGAGVLTLLEEARRRGVAHVLAGHRHLVTAVAFSPDGRLLASASRDRAVRLWDPAGHRPAAPPLVGHTDYVSCVAFSPRGGLLASASWDGTVRLWRARDGAPLATLPCGEAWVHWLAFSPDGTRLAAGDAYGRLHRFDVASRRRLGPAATAHERDILGVAYSPDGALIATGSLDRTIRLWDAVSGRDAAPPLVGHDSGVYTLAFSPDGEALASGSRDGQLRLWRTRDGVTTRSWSGHTDGVLAAVYSPDGDTLVTAGADKRIRLWRARGVEPIGPPLRGHLGLVKHLAFAPDGRTLASASRDHTIRLWNLASRGQGGLRLRGHEQGVAAVAFAPDGRTLASASRDGTVRLWSTRRRVEQQRPLQHGGAALAVGFSRDGRWLAAAGDRGQVLVWERGGGTPPLRLESGSREVLGLAFSPRSRLLAAAGSDGRIPVWRLADGARQRTLIGHGDAVYAVVFTPDGEHLISGGRDRSVLRWRARSGRPVGPIGRAPEAVYSLAISPDGDLVAAGCGDGTVRRWRTASMRPAGPPLRGHGHWVLALDFAPDGTLLASASSDGTVRLWTRAGRAWGPPLRGHTDWVNAVAFSPDGRTLASASADHTVWLWQLSAAATLRSLHRRVDRMTNLEVDLDGRTRVR